MAEKLRDGGPAFPVNDSTISGEPGMTLRDYFAAKAMQSLLVRGWVDNRPDSINPPHHYAEGAEGPNGADDSGVVGLMSLAFDSYKVADAMLAARRAK